jgi:hypothetical protein
MFTVRSPQRSARKPPMRPHRLPPERSLEHQLVEDSPEADARVLDSVLIRSSRSSVSGINSLTKELRITPDCALGTLRSTSRATHLARHSVYS